MIDNLDRSKLPKEIFTDLADLDSNLSDEILPRLRKFKFDMQFEIRDLIIYDKILPVNDPIANLNLDHGLRSVTRNGFYQIMGNIEPYKGRIVQTNEEYVTYKADVLYCPDLEHQKYYKFKATVGPLVNRRSMMFNFASRRNGQSKTIFGGIPSNQKRDFFISIINRPLYVAFQEMADDGYKETVWLLLG